MADSGIREATGDESAEMVARVKQKAPRKRRRPKNVEKVSRNTTPPLEVITAELEETPSAPTKALRPKAKPRPRALPPKASMANKLSRELAGLCYLGLAALLGLALMSYDSRDPGFGVSASREAVHNWVGVVGAYMADGLTLIFGMVAFAIPFLVAGASFGMFRPIPFRIGAREIAGGVCVLVGMAIFLDVVLGGAGLLAYPAGGLLGAVLGGHLARWIAPLGTGVLASFVMVLGVMLLRRRSLGSQVHQVRDFLSRVGAQALDGVAVWKEKRRLLDAERDQLLEELRAKEGESEADAEARQQEIQERAKEKARAALEQELQKKSDKPEPAWVTQPPAVLPGLNDTIEEPVVDGILLRLSEPPTEDVVPRAKQAKKQSKKDDADTTEDAAGLVIVERDEEDHKKQIEDAEKQKPDKKALFQLPPLKLLDYDAPERRAVDPAELQATADKLVRKFNDFGIDGRVREVRPGPVCTTYEFVPAAGIKVSRIAALADDIAMAMEAMTVRIVAPIPGKGAVGIEIPNAKREMVFLKEIVADPKFLNAKSKLEMALGKDIEGKPYTADLAGMPHVLISGTTGSGKSVSVNGMICSMLYRATPDEVKFLMIDPKMLELSIYEGIPHLLLPPITDSKKAANALRWAVDEMERRYQWMSDLGVRDLEGYNARVRGAVDGVDTDGKTLRKQEGGEAYEPLPYIVVVIDEYADLLAVAGKEVEGYVMRLAQKARAAGLHVMLATQRPSVDVITGVIKANFPVRMGFRLASVHDSKTIVNRPGAEKLLGRGDMLMMPAGTSNLTRVHGAYISEKELHRVVDYLKQQGTPNYDMSILETPSEADGGEFGDEDKDAKWDEALAVVARARRCSTSWLQRQLGIGYNRAAKIVEMMERENLIGPQLSAKGDRDIHIPNPE